MAGGRSGRGATATVLAAACLALAIALLLPAAAAAKQVPTFPGFGSGSGSEFSLGKRGAMRLNVSTEGQRVTVAVSEGPQSVNYEVRGRVAHGGIRADLGGAGRVNVKFEPSGPSEAVEPSPFCKGRPESVTQGVFAGTIVFTGDHHFAHFHATRVPGTVTRAGKLHCHFPGSHHPHSSEGESKEEAEKEVSLTASVKKSLAFVAISENDLVSSRPLILFAAISKETVGRVRIGRLVLMLARQSSAFSFDEGLTTATAAPPAPFRGSAVFERGAAGASPSWTGTLRVAFLDRTMALTGQGFKASLGNPREIGGSASRVP